MWLGSDPKRPWVDAAATLSFHGNRQVAEWANHRSGFEQPVYNVGKAMPLIGNYFCQSCEKTYPDHNMYSARCCYECRRIKNNAYIRAWKQRKREERLRLYGWKPRIYVRWTPEELERLREACSHKMTYAQAAVHVGRSANACAKMSSNWFLKGLWSGKIRRPHIPRWTPERLEPLYAAVRQFGPRGAARHLNLSPNAVAGALHRYPPPG